MTYTTLPPSRRLEGAPTLSGDYGHVRPRLNELSVEARVAQLRQAISTHAMLVLPTAPLAGSYQMPCAVYLLQWRSPRSSHHVTWHGEPPSRLSELCPAQRVSVPSVFFLVPDECLATARFLFDFELESLGFGQVGAGIGQATPTAWLRAMLNYLALFGSRITQVLLLYYTLSIVLPTTWPWLFDTRT